MRAARAGKVIPSSSIMPRRLTPYYLGAALLSTTAGAAETHSARFVYTKEQACRMAGELSPGQCSNAAAD